MIQFESSGPIGDVAADALIVPVFAERRFGPGAGEVASRLGDWVGAFFDAEEFSGKSGQVAVAASGWQRVIFVGLGDTPDTEGVRRAAGAAGRHVSRLARVATTLHRVEVGDAPAAVSVGLLLGQYRFDRHRSEPKPSQTTTLVLCEGTDAELEEARRAAIVAEAVAFVRDQVNEPSLNKPPTRFATEAERIGREYGIRVKVYDETEIAAGGFGALAGVALGTHQPARLVEMWYEPEGAAAFLAIVGKGITFDSGGLALKPLESMQTMKTDMAGGAAVMAAITAIARLGLAVRVLGIMPFTENMPGGGALRPGDVLTARNGKTIEVLDTDAEGRLVLSDGLSLAAEHSPDLIVDLATLTGSCVVALGDEIAGLFSNDAGAASRVLAAAAAAGERVWQLPLPDDYRKKIDSDVADLKNVGGRQGGAIIAAHFLKEFVGSTPWVHLDIAGPARAKSEDGYIVKGATGFGVRTLVALAEALASG